MQLQHGMLPVNYQLWKNFCKLSEYTQKHIPYCNSLCIVGGIVHELTSLQVH